MSDETVLGVGSWPSGNCVDKTLRKFSEVLKEPPRTGARPVVWCLCSHLFQCPSNIFAPIHFWPLLERLTIHTHIERERLSRVSRIWAMNMDESCCEWRLPTRFRPTLSTVIGFRAARIPQKSYYHNVLQHGERDESIWNNIGKRVFQYGFFFLTFFTIYFWPQLLTIVNFSNFTDCLTLNSL